MLTSHFLCAKVSANVNCEKVHLYTVHVIFFRFAFPANVCKM